MQKNWWKINSETLIDTPFLAVYEDRVRQNIEKLISYVKGDTQKLRPHIKTHKNGEILELFKIYNIKKVKCATIAEAELAAIHQIPDILLSYQPVGLKAERYFSLLKKHPDLHFSTIVDNLETANNLNAFAKENQLILSLYLDLNTGMNRTGFPLSENWIGLISEIQKLENIKFEGIHIYDGHIKGTVEERKQEASKAFDLIQSKINENVKIVAGGSNTFPFYAEQENVECSPGTFVFWDSNYQINLPEQDFKPALVIVGTIISKPTKNTFCIDIGYKAVSSENPIDKRLVILNDENLIPISHSEEHLVIENKGENDYQIGDIIYAKPYHVCPTVALYDNVQAINKKHQIYSVWPVSARTRKINF
ncbi:D-TA family PLP-dependent enzyme [Flavobacterium sp. DG2-3]|uniref:D-TA family PLP-dependent enzyme n=1 Tax=Flavobacterium sp. DG2-3 TaxID=3068317 RepID=UPI00273DB18C|nr:D-TA family PLP-dependent enzyme [Flavobacterium sp. DG2-3]MDP5198085.1 D-TA family PLP-dependent enzyme [Flavobacterium sp. DG2-3]